MLERLYPKSGTAKTEPTYKEILDLVKKAQPDQLTKVVLVGSHDDDSSSGHRNPMDDELFGDVVREIISKWPPPPFPLSGRDQGTALNVRWVEPVVNAQTIRREFAKVLATVLQPDRTGATKLRRDLRRVTVGPGPLPNAKDRLLPARRLLQGASVLANQEVVTTTRTPHLPQKALVYLDVSGSMSALLPYLADLLAKPARKGLIRVKQFSNQVAPLSVEALCAGELTTTYGTDIYCVLQDIVNERCRRALIVTDGYVGKPQKTQLAVLAERNIACTALLPAYGWTRDLEEHMPIYHLPHLEGT